MLQKSDKHVNENQQEFWQNIRAILYCFLNE